MHPDVRPEVAGLDDVAELLACPDDVVLLVDAAECLTVLGGGYAGVRAEAYPGVRAEGYPGEVAEGYPGEVAEGYTGEVAEGYTGEGPSDAAGTGVSSYSTRNSG